MSNNIDFEVLRTKIEYVESTLDEIRKDHLPAIRQTIKDEVTPLEKRISDMEEDQKIVERRVWVMYGTLRLVIPTLISTIIGLIVMYFVNRG